MRFRSSLALVVLALAACSSGVEAPPGSTPTGGGTVDLVLPAGVHEELPLISRVSDGPVKALSNVAVGDSLLYGYTLISFGPRATSGQICVRAVGSYTTGWTLPCGQPATALTGQFLAVNSSAWDSASFALWEKGVRGSLVARDSSLLATWKVIRGPGSAPGGSIDSTRVVAVGVTPKAFTVAAGGRQTVCAELQINARWELAGNASPSCSLVPTRHRQGPPVLGDLQLAQKAKALKPFAKQLMAAGMATVEADKWAKYQ